MTLQSEKIKKIISSTLFLSLVLGAVFSLLLPSSSYAQWVTTDPANTAVSSVGAGSGALNATVNTTSLGFKIKEAAKDIATEVLKSVAKKALQQMTKSTINWINSGFHGSPLFVENPKSFFNDIAKFEVKTLVDQFGYDTRRFPFGKSFALNLINSYKTKIDDNAQYTLSPFINDPVLLNNYYRNNFSFGGWNGFLMNNLYPQNNYLGFQMIATEEAGRRLQGIAQNNAQKVQTTLEQGMGFLSPQVCPSNSKYNNLTNPFQKPSFVNTLELSNSEKNAKNACYGITASSGGIGTLSGPAADACAKAIDDQYNARVATAKARWAETNDCPGGLITTTPGAVVANQIVTAMSSTFRKTELGTALGGSISAVLDSLLNHFLDKGLNALTSTANPQREADEWNYNGETLGGPADSGNGAWDAGPDQEVVLNDFKKQIDGKTLVNSTDSTGAEVTTEEIGKTGNGVYIPGDIANTETELKLISSEAAVNKVDVNDPTLYPGIIQILGKIWPKIRELDICLPGPDLGWQDRTDKEKERNSIKLQAKTSDNDPDKAAAALLDVNELKFAVDSFKDWINNKMLTALPSSVLYMDAVDEIDALSQQADELVNRQRTKNQALARLQAIKTSLETFDEQPEVGSGGEKVLINLRKQYSAVNNSISNTATIEDARNELAIAKDRLDKLINPDPNSGLIAKCEKERRTKGWSVPGGWSSTLNNSGAEKAVFCDAPIAGGYDHEAFRHENDNEGKRPNPVTHPELPYVNASSILKWRNKTVSFFTFGLGGKRQADITMSCNIIYKANIVDYKKSIPGVTNVVESYQPPVDDTGTVDETDTSTPPVTPPGTPPVTPPGTPPGGVALSVFPTAGTHAVMSKVTLTATNGDAGQFYYYFYCDRNQTDSFPPVPSGFVNSPVIVTQSTYTPPIQCSYTTPGTYHPKVTSWRIYDTAGIYAGDKAGAWRQANATVTVQ